MLDKITADGREFNTINQLYTDNHKPIRTPFMIDENKQKNKLRTRRYYSKYYIGVVAKIILFHVLYYYIIIHARNHRRRRRRSTRTSRIDLYD